MKAFYDEKVASLQATIDQKEEERGDLIVELNQVRNGGKKKVEETSNGLPLKMEDILRVRVSINISLCSFQSLTSCILSLKI